MNQRLLTVLLFAMAVAGLTSFGLYRMILSHVGAPARQAIATTKVVAATHDLQVGALLKESDLREVQISGSLPATALHSVGEAVGRGVISPIYVDEPVLSTRLANKGSGAGLAALIPVGMRAVALPVNEVVGLAGFVAPGMRVDVLMSSVESAQISVNQSIHGSETGAMCRTILQNIEVLSAGQKIERNIEGKPESAQVVNLLVTPSQAEIINLVNGAAKVQLVLRNPLDTTKSDVSGASMAGLLGGSDDLSGKSPLANTARAVASQVAHSAVLAPKVIRVPAAPRLPEIATVEVFNGTRHTEQKFEMASK